ncbi:MAG: hypothetical protein AVDCRST_MAG57-2542, partial [uncultured Blastococcus sp.]
MGRDHCGQGATEKPNRRNAPSRGPARRADHGADSPKPSALLSSEVVVAALVVGGVVAGWPGATVVGALVGGGGVVAAVGVGV